MHTATIHPIRVPRVPTLIEAMGDYADYARDRGAAQREIDEDMSELKGMAMNIVACFGALKTAQARLGEARYVSDANGRSAPATPELDSYAAVEGLLFDKLAGPAETLLKLFVEEIGAGR